MLVPIGDDGPDVGGKARGLALARAAGLDVPSGFVVPAQRFRDALAAAGGLPDAPEASLLALRASALALPVLPDVGSGPFVVRSSATIEDAAAHAAPGVFRSRRDVAVADVPSAVAAVWASLLEPTAAAYLALRRIPWRDAAMAVIIQEQKPGLLATAYSRAPGASGDVLVETTDGAARALVGDAISGRIPGLSDDALRAAARAARRMEDALGAPADVELVFGERLWVVQARPIPPAAARQPVVDDAELAAALAFSRDEPEALWSWDATHNPAPLSPAQAGLVALVEAAHAATVRQRVVLGYLYTTRHGAPPPLRRIDEAALARTYESEIAPAFARALARMGGDLDETLDAYVELYRLYARVLAPNLRGAAPIPIAVPAVSASDLAAAWDVGSPTYGEQALPERGWRPAATLRDVDDLVFAQAQAKVRQALGVLADRWAETTSDLAFLPLDELRGAARRGIAPTDVAARAEAGRAEAVRLAGFAPPLEIMNGRAIFAPHPSETGLFRGRGSGGRARGRVKKLDPQEPRSAGGAILVCAAAPPTLAPLVADAAALVVEHDGLLGHGAALARELGIPCVVGCAGAFAALRDGDEIWVDADAGVVLKL